MLGGFLYLLVSQLTEQYVAPHDLCKDSQTLINAFPIQWRCQLHKHMVNETNSKYY